MIVDLWVWSGCTMHKDLNTMKGGVEMMSKWWAEFGNGIAPVALMNKFNSLPFRLVMLMLLLPGNPAGCGC